MALDDTNFGEEGYFTFDVANDYKELMDEISLRTSHKTKQHLMIIRLVAHAQNGHGFFKSRDSVYPDITPDHVYHALDDYYKGGFDADEWKDWGQGQVESVLRFLERISEGQNPRYYHDEDGEPLLGYDMFRGLEIVDHDRLLIGAYLGGIMDQYDPWRIKLEKKHGVKTGGGICSPINLEAVMANGLDVAELENCEHTLKDIEKYKGLGVIPEAPIQSSATILNGYVRLKKGRGVCDDLAITNAGILYGMDAALGVFLADAVDTWDKNVPLMYAGGQDELIPKIIAENEGARRKTSRRFKLPTEDHVLAWMMPTAAVHYPIHTPWGSDQLPHCSQSYMLQIDKEKDQNIIESNLAFIGGNKYRRLFVSHPSLGVTNKWLFGKFTTYLREDCRKIYSTLFGRRLEQFLIA
jgi:hypothetical protein